MKHVISWSQTRNISCLICVRGSITNSIPSVMQTSGRLFLSQHVISCFELFAIWVAIFQKRDTLLVFCTSIILTAEWCDGLWLHSRQEQTTTVYRCSCSIRLGRMSLCYFVLLSVTYLFTSFSTSFSRPESQIQGHHNALTQTAASTCNVWHEDESKEGTSAGRYIISLDTSCAQKYSFPYWSLINVMSEWHVNKLHHVSEVRGIS
jgi:hypothetical protein